MGRELKRVALDFDWPLQKVWQGYINPLDTSVKCPHCEMGMSPEAKHLHDLWWGYVEFKPEDNGSTPLTVEHPYVRWFAERNCTSSPSFYGSGEEAILREARRLLGHWNGMWQHHLNQEDVDAIRADGGIWDFDREWIKKEGDERPRWYEKDVKPALTAKMVNDWGLQGMNQVPEWPVMKARLDRMGAPYECAHCEEGSIWPSEEAKLAYENWQRVEPPDGPGYQIWETVTEGSPLSPVFETAEELAEHMATTRFGADSNGTSFDQWMKFINGPGWAPSFVMIDGRGLIPGEQAV